MKGEKELLALTGGLLLPFSFAPYDLIPLAFVSLGLLFFSWIRAASYRQILLSGFLFGLGQFGAGVSWVYISLHHYGGASVLTATIMTAAFVAALALFTMASATLAGFFRQSPKSFQLIVVFPLAWMVVEWLRNWLFTGFTWLQIGNSQLDSPLASFAPLFGVLGIGYFVALITGLLCSLFFIQRAKWLPVFVSISLIFASSFFLGQQIWTQPEGEPFKVTLIQGNIPQDQKWRSHMRQKTLSLYHRKTLENLDSRLIVWPETAIPALYHQVKEGYLDPLARTVRAAGADVLIGVPVEKEGSYYNALISIGSDSGFYFKRHLVPFGEYLPLKPLSTFVTDLLEIPMSDFGVGTDEQPLLRGAGYPLAATICYEDIFGHEARMGLPEARFLVNVTNDAWFGDTAAPHQHFQMARMRALESGRYMLRSTNSGLTGIVAPDGSVVAEAPLFEEAVLSGEITAMEGETPYVRWGDVPVVCFLFLQLGAVILYSKRAKRRQP